MIPKPIYEALPFIYSPVGLFAAMSLNGVGRICGVMLISASVVIFTMRRIYRGG